MIETINGWVVNWNAVIAEENNLFTASRVARKLKVPIEFIKKQNAVEWHHTSKYYNRVDYYDYDEIRRYLNTTKGAKELANVIEDLKKKKSVKEIIYKSAEVKWLEWSGSRKHPKAVEMSATGATVRDRGGKFVEITLPSGRIFRKGRDTRGFEVYVDGQRVIF